VREAAGTHSFLARVIEGLVLLREATAYRLIGGNPQPDSEPTEGKSKGVPPGRNRGGTGGSKGGGEHPGRNIGCSAGSEETDDHVPTGNH
jgi:hypothetical protein